MNETGILIGGATLFAVAIILTMLSGAMERMGNASPEDARGCVLNGLLMLIVLPLMIFAGFAVVLAGIYVIMTYGG